MKGYDYRRAVFIGKEYIDSGNVYDGWCVNPGEEYDISIVHLTNRLGNSDVNYVVIFSDDPNAGIEYNDLKSVYNDWRFIDQSSEPTAE